MGGTVTGGMVATDGGGGTNTGGRSGLGGAGGTATGGTMTGGTQLCDKNGSGRYDNYTWHLFSDGWSNTNKACLTTASDGAISLKWNFASSDDLFARVGLKFDATKTHQELGTFSADFAESKTGSTVSSSVIGIFGNTRDPIVQFYISEDSFRSPTKPRDSQVLGMLVVDGGTYDIYMTTASAGPTTYTTIDSIRQERRSSGHISLSTHFARWEELGVTMGKMQEVDITAEVLGGTGSVDFTKVKVEVN
jgi:hypothetical protein